MRNSVILTLVVAALALPNVAASESSILLGPRVGYYKTFDSDEGNLFGGGALRLMFTRGLGAEVAADYHSEDAISDVLDVRTIPVTASAIVSIFPAIYLAGGLGWYHTSFAWDDEAEALGFEDKTERNFGYQFGGGLMLGGAESGRPAVMLDARWHFLDEGTFENQVENMELDEIDADFWSANAGLMFRFH